MEVDEADRDCLRFLWINDFESDKWETVVYRFCRRLFNHPKVKAELQTKRVTWRFNLERAPWWGGFFEIMVRSVKRCLRKVIGNAKLTVDGLATVLVEIEGTLNARPLIDEYLTGLREFHKCKSGNARKSVKKGDVVTVYGEGEKVQ